MPLPELFGACVYTIVDLSDLDAYFQQGGAGSITEGRRWVTAKEMLAESERKSQPMPIFFSDARRTGALHYWAVLTDIQHQETGSSISFRDMRCFKKSKKPKQNSLTVNDRDRRRKLSMSHRRPYVNCKTPSAYSALYRQMEEANVLSAEDILVADDASEFAEGLKSYRLHRHIERNRSIVQRKKSHAIANGGLKCEVCRFDFRAAYGEIGDGFIECHHTVPISEYKPNQKTRIQDLVLVCSNCHRMLHRNRLLTVDALVKAMARGSEGWSGTRHVCD